MSNNNNNNQRFDYDKYYGKLGNGGNNLYDNEYNSMSGLGCSPSAILTIIMIIVLFFVYYNREFYFPEYHILKELQKKEQLKDF